MMKQKLTHLLFATAIFCIGMFANENSWGQISLASLELGTTSFSSNSTGAATFTTYATGISAAPSLTLTASQQGQAGGAGYVSSKTWNNASFTSTTYWQFTLSAATGYTLTSISSISIKGQRSGTGATTAVLRSSADSYAANIGGTVSPSNGSNGTVTFSSLGLTSLSSVTFRVYGYGASSATGTWRIGDGTASSLDIDIQGTVALSCSAPTTQTAIGTVSSTTGGMTIPVSGGNGDSRLIRFNTSAPSLSPVDGTTYTAATSYATAGTEQTVLAGSGTTVTTSNLAANTLYYYKAWEYNACSASPKYNTTSAPSGSFTTLQNAPTVGSGSGATSSAFTAAWTAPSGGGAETYTYSIDVDDNSAFTSINFSQTGIASGTTTANVNSGLSAFTPYYYRVKAVNAGGSSAWSSTSAAYSTLPGDPTVTTPTAVSITDIAADLGANITSNGGGTITDYGTVYKTSAGVTITDNFLSAGTSNIQTTFSHTRSLSPETHYYYKGYATNAANTVLTSTEGNFYTLSSPPQAAAGSFSSSPFSYSQIDLTFAAASTITNADGYIILQRTGAAPTGIPSNANAYSVGNTIGNGTVAAIVNSTSATTQSITGLSANTNYYFVIIPYNADATPTAATYNYYSTSAPSTNSTTPTVPTPTIASFTSHEYVGGIMTITGTNLSGVTSVTIGGTSASFVLNGSNLDVTIGTTSGQISITNGTNSANSGASNFSNDGYVTIAAGNYSTAGTWQGGVPTTTLPITIAHAVTLSAAVTVSPTAININSGGSLALSSYTITSSGSVSNNGTLDLGTGTLTLASGIGIANTNTFTSGTGTIIFTGSNTVTGTHSFYNATLNGSVNFGSASTVTGTMTMNTGASVTTNAPTYASGSTLAYAASLTAGTEWTLNATSGVGVPYHVTIASTKTLTLGGTGYRQMLGNLTTTGALTLTGTNDFKIAGNWSGAGAFTHGSRTVYFNGTSQTLSNAATLSGVVVVSPSVVTTGITGVSIAATGSLDVNSGAYLKVASSHTITFTSGATININGTLENASGTITANSAQILLNSGSTYVSNSTQSNTTQLTNCTMNANATWIFRNGCTTPTLTGRTYAGNLRFESTSGTYSPGYSGSGTCTIGGDLYIGSSVTLPSSGWTGTFSVAGNVTVNGSSNANHNLTLTGASKTISGSGTITFGTINVNGSYSMNNNITSTGSTTFVNGILYMGSNVLSGTSGCTISTGATLGIGHTSGINGNITVSGTKSYSTTANYIFNGASAQTSGASFPATVNNFEVNGAGISTLSNSLNVNGTLTLTTGNITLGNNSVVISSTGTLTGGSNSSYFATTGTGTLTLPNISGSPKLFPVGLAANYTPVTLTNSGTTSNFSVRAKSSITNAAYGAKYVDVEWPITAATSGSNISAVFQWNAVNQVGSFNPSNSCELARWTGSGYLVTNTGITPSGTDPYTLTASGLTSFTSPNNIYVLGEVSNVTQPVTTPTLSSFTPDAGYGGTTITLSGSNFFGVSQVTIGGQPVTILSNNGSNTITVVAGGRSGQIIVTNSAGSANSSALSPNAFRSYGYKTTQAGDWNTAATWFNNLIPQVGSHVTVDHFITINASVTDQMDSVIITSNGKISTGSSSATLTCGNIYNNNIIDMTTGGTITLAGGSTFTNANTFTAGAGKIAFAGAGTCVGAFTFNNIDASGALNVGSATTINGTLQILSGGSLTNNAPIYGSASTLKYATTGTVSPSSNEWAPNVASGNGIPYNVTVASNTNLDFGSASQYYQMLAAMTVNSGSTLTLSSQSGGDLKIKGNFACSGTFTPNNRTVEFNGTAQSITTASTFNFIKVDAATALSIAATGVTLNGTGSNALQVDNTATLNINSGKSLILNIGSSANIDGTVNNSGIFTNSNTATGNLIFTSTALYQHNISGGSIPAFGTWNTGSTCEIKVAGTSAPTNLNQAFYNFKWNCASQASACNLGGNLTTINGDFTITTTNGYDLRLMANAVSTTLTVGGNMYIDANAWVAIINSGTTGTGSSVLTINGNLTVNDGTLDMAGTDTHLATKSTINLKGDLTIIGNGAITKTNGTPAEMNFIKPSGTQTFTSSNNYVIGNHLSVFNVNIGNGTSTNKLVLANDFILSSTTTATNNVITVKTNATLSCGTSIIDEDQSGNKATFTVQSGATLESGSATGIDGNIQTYSSARTLPTTANYSYNGAVNQVTGSLLPTTVNTLNIANTASNGVVALSNSTVTPTNLNLTSGNFDLNFHTVNMPTSGVITATAGNFAATLNNKLNFAGSNTVSGSVNFYPKVTLNGSVDFGSASTINDTMVMNTGASITTNPPSYAVGSKLRYNQGGTIARSNEWNATTGAGYPHHIQISNNTTVNVSNGTPTIARSIAGDLTINVGSKLNMNTATDQMTAALIIGGTTNLYGTLELSALSGANINVAGNWIHDASASFIENGSPVIFAGAAPQTIQINGGGTEAFDNLVINNSSTGTSSGVVLGNNANATNLNIASTLTLTNGKLNANGNEVFVQNDAAAAITGYSAVHSSSSNSFVIGNLRRRVSTTTMAAYEFPLGTDAGKYEIAKINITSNTDVDNLLANFTEFNPSCPFAGNAPNFSVTPTNGGIPTLVDNMLNLGYYIVEPYDASKTLVASPTITYDAIMTFNGHNNGVTSNALAPKCYTIIKRSSSCTGAWSLAGGSLDNTTQQGTAGTSTTITAKLSGLTSFSQFGAGFNSNGDVLPVELTEFNVALKNNNAELKWITASERNSEKFEIERSTDGILFDKAGFVDAAGTSNNLITYNFIDKNVSALNVNVIYYRLRQVDFDGSYSYSPIKSISINKSFTGLSIDAIYPNPFMESVKIKVAMQNAANLTYELYDNKGTIVLTNNVTVDKGESTIVINGLSNLSQGIYLLKMNDGVNVHTSILQKQ